MTYEVLNSLPISVWRKSQGINPPVTEQIILLLPGVPSFFSIDLTSSEKMSVKSFVSQVLPLSLSRVEVWNTGGFGWTKWLEEESSMVYSQ